MPKDYKSLYTELRTKFPEQISQNVDSVIQHVCNICVYLDRLSAKGVTINLPFWGKTRFMESTTFSPKLSHFKRLLINGGYTSLPDITPGTKEFNAVVTGYSSFKVSKQYKELVSGLIRAIGALGNGEKESCLQECEKFVDRQFPDTSMTNSNYPNCPV